jgi:hypothetical protein
MHRRTVDRCRCDGLGDVEITGDPGTVQPRPGGVPGTVAELGVALDGRALQVDRATEAGAVQVEPAAYPYLETSPRRRR